MFETKQALFDAVITHLAKQGKQAAVVDDDGQVKCRYRLPCPDGTTLKCAIGALIPDADYIPQMEDQGVSGYGSMCATIAKAAGIAPSEREFAGRLQTVHDNSETLISLQHGLAGIASQYGLNAILVDTITTWEAIAR